MTQETIQEQVIARALKDPSFRQALLSNPRAVLAEQYHVHLPEGVAVCVLEEAPNTLTLVLPAREEAVVELTDAELLGASGRGGLGSLQVESLCFCPPPIRTSILMN
jgi:hypothetical protein